jgi:HEAT repeat protein
MHPNLSILLTLALLTGCSARSGPRGLASDDSAEKIPAIKRAGEQRDGRTIPLLIKELNNDDPAVRFYAIEALERITGQTLDYHYYDSEASRAAAVGRWEKWLNQK